MANIVVPYSFIPGTKANPNEVNANFISLANNISTVTTAVETKLNTDLSNINSAGLDFLKNNTAPSRNIGEIVASTLPLTDAGLHLLDGALIDSSGIYSAFVEYIASIYDASASYFCTEADWQTSVNTYGVCGKFVYDSTNNTVRLPKITGIIEGTTDATALGNLVEAGLPNITGNIAYGDDTDAAYMCRLWTADGAFAATYTANRYTGNFDGGSSGTWYSNANFNAARSSAIYGNSSTVQPQTIKCYYYIVIATSTKTDIQVDIDEIATDLSGKADTDLVNVTNSAKSMIASMGMPTNVLHNFTIGASGATYTMPNSGWLHVFGTATVANGYIYMNNNTAAYNQIIYSPATNYQIYYGIPVSKGDIVEIGFGGATLQEVRLNRAKGDSLE